MAAGREKVCTALAIACVAAAISIAASLELIRRRRRRRSRSPAISGGGTRSCCELEEKKPQNKFRRVLVDNSYSPFKHLKRESRSTGSHPYEGEISSLLENPPSLFDFLSENIPLNTSNSYTWVDSEAQLESLAKILSKQRVFAIDTEQHSLRSFLGYTALMQISTEEGDYLIDTIVLHDAMSILRSVFADPSICKVFHGADNDVLWLQRDFHIYVVNMFDTAKACEILMKPQKSLAYLLETYCDVMTDKTLQREDWRIRPLSDEMIEYARCDAHYLLYIASCLASELQKKTCDTSTFSDDKSNFLFEASRRSNLVSMQIYTKEIESIPGSLAATSICSRNLHIQELDPLKTSELKDIVWKLCAWRDLMARMHDESLRYVLSDQSIASLSVKLPKCPQDIYSTILESDQTNNSSNFTPPLPIPSPIIFSHSDELTHILQDKSANIEDIFKLINCCPMSAFNYSLLSQLSLRKGNFLSLASNGGGKVVTTTGGGSKKQSRELFIKKFSCKSPVYHNCRIYASDGRLLCYCDRKKLDWYLQRDLAKMIEREPPAIMLLFEPKGRPEDEDNDFYIQSKKNICVGCGEKSHYIRYRIIPSCYRIHFPEHLKSHRSHDIVLLCVDCHERAHSSAERYKKRVAKEFGVPLFVERILDRAALTGRSESDGIGSNSNGNGNTSGSGTEGGVSPLQLRTAAMALLRHGASMPSERHEELMQTVKQYYGGREITQKDLEQALLVGMSPNERRRFHKKKGFSLHNNKNNHNNIINIKNNNNTFETLAEEISEGNVNVNGNGNENNKCKSDENFSSYNNDNNNNYNNNAINNLETLTEEINREGNENASVDGDGNGNNKCSYNNNNCEMDKRLSYLGHGPHGKLVVEYLLSNYGEEGICQFCQRWRQVFVESIQPQFLPSGWNIKHR